MEENYLDPYMKRGSRIPYITISIIIVNFIVFTVMEIKGSTESVDFMLEHGALTYDSVVNDGEYYRLITSFFMHFGFEHIANNMAVLAILGYYLENIIKRRAYIILYMLSGVLAGAISMIWHHMLGDYCVSAGASGAVFGLIGGLVFLIISDRSLFKAIGIPRLIVFFLLIFYNGRVNSEIDNAAHIAGFIVGIIIMCIIRIIKKGDIEHGKESR